MYQVLARKWRPQSFDELVGQGHVARALGNAVTGRRLAHAYLFAGLRGTGKTTVARILAKCLNCETGPTVSPCAKCAPCAEITESRAMDVLEIDAASRTKVEQTRELLEMVSYAPVRDRYKILIIDEAHMLSKASFNALLKTLEEPPPNVVFVLATTEIQKVLPTILSRCQVFEFRRVTAVEVSAFLRKICDAEKIDVSPISLDRLARAGEGSVRDSLSALERVLAFCGDKVADEDVLRLLGAVRAEVLNGIVAAMSRRDAAGMLSVLDALVDEGHDLVHFWSELISALRDLLLMDVLPGRPEILGRSAEEAASLGAAAAGLSREDLSRIFRILADFEPGLKSSSQPQFLFEATLIRIASLGAVRPIEEFLAALGGTPAASTAPRPVSGGAAPSRPATRPPAPQKKNADPADLVSRIREARPMLAALLEQASSIELDARALRIEFEPGMAALKRTLEQPDNLASLRQAASPGGAPIEVVVTVPPVRPAAPAATSPAAPAARAAAGRTLSRSLLDRIRDEPAVGKLLDTFGAQVVDVRPFDYPAAADRDDATPDEATEEG